MSEVNLKEAADFIHNDLRLKTLPVGVKFLKNKQEFPEKTRRPSINLGKKVAICQGITMARNYGWTVGLAQEDIICVPAAIAFGFSSSEDPPESLAQLFCEINFSKDEQAARSEVGSMSSFANGEIEAMVIAPLNRAAFEPDTILIYGNPAQMMRLIQACSYITGERVAGHFGGKVECDEYLITPYKTQSPRVVVPGNGERIFAGTQDDEMTFALPAGALSDLLQGLREVGKAIGVRYPVTPFLNYQPDFPKAHKEMGKRLGVY
jgi:uncharacterized protein (DUF169 family)